MSSITGKANILYVTHDTGLIGGAERQLLELLKGIDRDKYTPHLVCIEVGGLVAERAREIGVPVHHVTRSWRWDMGVVTRLRRFIKDKQVSIVHAYLGLPGFYGALAGKLGGAKVITTIRIAGPRMRFTDVSERFAFLISDSILSNSKAGADFYFKRFPGRHKTQVIYNGYRLSEFDQTVAVTRADLGLPEDSLVIGHVANLTYLKDYPTFLQALTRVFRVEPRAVAVIVGDGAKRENYESLAGSLGINERTCFVGHRRDVLGLVKTFDIGVLASHPDYSEGLSNSVAEYMGMSKPVVATDVGGNRELVGDGVSGYLSPAGKPEPLSDRIIDLLRNDDLRQDMGRQGRKFFEENLTLERMVSETQRVYERLLAG
jgi:glycosyltransferase involved in cell wall biosynthesis